MGREGSKLARTVSLDMRLHNFSKASDCSGPHDHRECLCVSSRIGSVIAARFGTKRATLLTNPRKLLDSVTEFILVDTIAY